MATRKFMPGTAELSFYNTSTNTAFIIPLELTGEITFSEKDSTKSVPTQAGEIDYPANRPKIEFTAEVWLPNINYPGPLFGAAYTPAVDNVGGKYISKVGVCSSSDTWVAHVHPVCNTDDHDDLHVNDVTVVMNREFKFTTDSDPQKETLNLLVSPDADGVRYFSGRHSTVATEKYNPETNTWDAVAS